jgi:hypothetical protein
MAKKAAAKKASPVAGDSSRVVVPGVAADEVELAQLDRSRQIALKRIKEGDQRPTMTQVPLKNQPVPMRTRFANTSISGRAYDLSENKGWIPVKFDELANPGNGEFKRTAEGAVSRGAGAHDILFKMPEAQFQKIQQAKAKRINDQIGSPKKMRDSAAEQAGTEGHDAAAERIAKLSVDQFKVGRNRVDVDDVNDEA